MLRAKLEQGPGRREKLHGGRRYQEAIRVVGVHHLSTTPTRQQPHTGSPGLRFEAPGIQVSLKFRDTWVPLPGWYLDDSTQNQHVKDPHPTQGSGARIPIQHPPACSGRTVPANPEFANPSIDMAGPGSR